MNTLDKEIRTMIHFLNHSKKLNRKQQIKRDNLFANDFSRFKDLKSDHESKGFLEKKDTRNGTNEENVKSSLPQNEEISIESENDKTKFVFCLKYTSPKIMYNFLHDFNYEPILKYTCHEIDSHDVVNRICELTNKGQSYSFEKHLSAIKRSFEMLTCSYKSKTLDRKIVAMIQVYLLGQTSTGRTTWSNKECTYSWSNKELLEWSKANPGLVPNPGKLIKDKENYMGYRLPKPFISPLSNERIMYFNELNFYFKSLFQIRLENNLFDLLSLRNEKFEADRFHFCFTKQFKKNIQLFTDVEKVLEIYDSIVSICDKSHKDKTEKIEINLSFFEESSGPVLEIHDINSVYGKSLSSSQSGIGDLQETLIRSINGICDLYVEADFGDNNYARLGLWNKNVGELDVKKPNTIVETLQFAQGVKYILKFEVYDISN